jgi:TRAP transporter TAXI family solute receptor
MVRIVDKYVFKILLVLGVVAAVVAGILFWRSLPQTEFTILTGREGGGYYQTAQKYQKIAAEKGFKLNIRPTAGSVEALELLEKGEADVGFIQGGIALDADERVLGSLASVYYEPVWVVLRTAAFDDPPPKRVTALMGKNIGIGEDGSGTQRLALQLLNAVGVTGTDANYFAGSSDETIDKLASGELDAALFVTTVESSTGQRLLKTPGLWLMDIEQADAIATHFPFLRMLTVPEGSLDLARNLPVEDKRLLATTANLVVRKDIHPDLLRLLTIAAVETHWRGDLFAKRNEFPNTDYSDLPVDRRGAAYLERIKNGESTFDNYLPFRWAAVAERYMLFVLPFVFLVIPIVTRAPLVYTFWNRWKVNRWYKTVAGIEQRLPDMDLYQLRQELSKVQELDDNLLELVNLPNGQLPSAYNLHVHIDILLQKMRRREEMLANSIPPEPPVA